MEEKKQAQAGLDAQREALNAEARERDRRLRELEQDLLAAQDKRHKLELSLQKVDSDISLMEQRIWDEYELTYAAAAELRQADFKLTGAQTEINRRRREISELGTVNVNAIEEYVAHQGACGYAFRTASGSAKGRGGSAAHYFGYREENGSAVPGAVCAYQ